MDRTSMEVVEFAGWPRCVRLSNGQVELVVTTDVGPRILRFGFVGGQNFFHVFHDTEGLTGGDTWHSFGGHRLWHAPEAFPRTYEPDNVPAEYSWDGSTLTLRSVEHGNHLEKEISVTLSPSAPQVSLTHRITNRGQWPLELAVWALSVMAQRGEAIYPQEPYVPHPDCLTPARPLVLWHFTDMSDPRWTWGRKYIRLRQDPTASTKAKAGLLNTAGWAAYVLGGEVFVKRCGFDAAGTYADMGCNNETYTDPDFLELETLSPLTKLEPGASVEHDEQWLLARRDCGPTDEDVDQAILPLLDLLTGA